MSLVNSVMNFVSFTPLGCVVRYAGSHLRYSCNCSGDPSHMFDTHIRWRGHVMQDYPAHAVLYECSGCSKCFTNIRSIAQHSLRCALVSPSNMVTPETMVECSYCVYRARNKRGLSRHLHRSHPNELYDKFINKRLIDRRWMRCEEKVLAKTIYKLLKQRGLPIVGRSLALVARECYLKCKHRISKSFRRVRVLFSTQSFLETLVEIEERKGRSRHERTTRVDFDDNYGNSSTCDCLNKIRDDLVNLVGSATTNELHRQKRRGIIGLLNKRSSQLGAFVLKIIIYKGSGKKTDGRSENTDQRSRREPIDNHYDNNELFKRLKSKSYLNHLCNPALMGLKPSKEAIEWFGRQFERPSINDKESFVPLIERAVSTCSIHAFIGMEEVERHLKSFDVDTASGADGFAVPNLKSVPVKLLAILMNCFLLEGDVPEALKINRTTLLAKKPDPGPQEWRPITVSSVLYRLFSKIITERLAKETSLSPHQRAFMRGIDGCGENISVVAALIKKANAGQNPLMVCSLDLAKAFDSVSFSSIVRALMRQRVDPVSLSLLKNLLYGNVTIVAKDYKAKITRGVRQGDPISPLLFNLVIDELFSLLKDRHYGASYVLRNGERSQIAAVAFADDITLLCNSQISLERQLATCVKFFTRRGMRINISKSSCLAIGRLPKSDVCTPLPVKIEVKDPDSGSMELLPCLRPDSELRILGAYISPLGKPEFQMGRLCELLEIVEHSNLESYHKITIIREHLVFKFRFQVVYGGVKASVARIADRHIRECVRKIYDLPPHAAKAFFYLPRSHGGLGIERLEYAAIYLRTKTELRLLASERVATRESISLTKVKDGYLRGCELLGRQEEWQALSVVPTQSPDDQLLRQLRDIDAEKWYLDCRKCQVQKDLNEIRTMQQGAAFHHLENAPNSYLIEPERYNLEISKIPLIYAIRLGTIKVLSNLRRCTYYSTTTASFCRLCRRHLETPMHVLQTCKCTRAWRIERHNAVASLLYRELVSQVNGEHDSVLKEPELVLGSNTDQNEVRLKPDLIVVSRKIGITDNSIVKIAIIDIVCCWEHLNGSSLRKAYDRKCNRYKRLEDWLCIMNNVDELQHYNGEPIRLGTGNRDSRVRVKVFPFVIGTRGGWLESNLTLWQYLEIESRKGVNNRIMRTAMERSVNIFKKFMGKVRSDE